MPSGRVVEPNEIYLNGRYYKLIGQVRRSLVSQLPPKVTLGEFNEASNPIASSITWSDLTGGMGQEVMRAGDPPNKVFHSDANLSAPGQITVQHAFQRAAISTFSGLDPRAAISVPSMFSNAPSGFIGYTSSASGTGPATPIVLRVYLEPGEISSVQVARALATNPLQIAFGEINGARYIAVPTGLETDWSTNPFSCATWNRNTTDISYVAFWRELLWGYSSAGGGLYFTADPSGAWTQVSTFQEADVYGMLVAPAADGTPSLYIVTDRGLYIYDSENERVVPTPLNRSFVPTDGRIPFAAWRGAIYIANRALIYEYIPGAGINVLTPFQNAIPAEFDVPITSLVPEFQHLWILSASSALSSAGTYQTVYTWDGRKFSILREDIRSEATPEAARVMYHQAASRGLGLVRVAKAHSSRNAQVQFADLPNDILRPLTSVDGLMILSSGGEIVLPWLQKDGAQEWLALQADLDTVSPSTAHPVHLDYGLDFSSTWSSMGFNSTTGEKSFQFPTTGDQVGSSFRAIRFRVRPLTSGAATLTSPTFKRLAFSYLRKPRPLWGFDIVLDLKEDYKGYTPQQQREAVEAVVANTPLVELTYKSGSFFVQALAPESLEDPKVDYTTYRLRLTEAI